MEKVYISLVCGIPPQALLLGTRPINQQKPQRLLALYDTTHYDIQANFHNKNLGILSMEKAEDVDGFAPGKYVRRKSKAKDTQYLNTRLLYDLIRKHRIYTTSKFTDLISNQDLVVHSIASIILHRFNVPKEPILCTFANLQNKVH